MTTSTFKCAICEGVYATETSNEEAKEELKDNFGDYKPEECEIICDDCYYKMFPQFKKDIEVYGS